MQLLIVDSSGIQPYVFGSNRLRENIGGSHLVAKATGAWALEALRRATPRCNVTDKPLGFDDIRPGPDVSLDGEVIYMGGGNFVALFASVERSEEFTRLLSRRVLCDAPELTLVIEHIEIGPEESFSAALTRLTKQLARAKRERTASAPLLGLGVTRKCSSTELPAVGMTTEFADDPSTSYPASAAIHAKLAVVRPASREADLRLREVIPPPDGFDYPSDFEELGRSHGESSHIAVVHLDGDGVGDELLELARKYPRKEDDVAYVQGLRQLSRTVNEAGSAALRETVQLLIERIDPSDGCIVHRVEDVQLARIDLRRRKGEREWLLPVRPVVFGGDDVSFVADGRLGLALAIAYLRRFAKYAEGLTASAGVAVVKSHYPFGRAHDLAEQLCKSAKGLRKELRGEGERQGLACIDWHFALSGLSGDLKEIRRREYQIPLRRGESRSVLGSLTLRPVTLGSNPLTSHKSWGVVARGVTAFQGPHWARRRNKIKALREALREGPTAVNEFLAQFNDNRDLPVVEEGLTDWPRQGWQHDDCGYFDAVELADWFIPLEGEPS